MNRSARRGSASDKCFIPHAANSGTSSAGNAANFTGKREKPMSGKTFLTQSYTSPFVPKAIIQATCEQARELLIIDRTTAPPGEGLLATWNSTDGTKYSKFDKRPILSHVTQALLAKFGSLVNDRSGSVRLIRV